MVDSPVLSAAKLEIGEMMGGFCLSVGIGARVCVCVCNNSTLLSSMRI